jgi:hypothetical protein
VKRWLAPALVAASAVVACEPHELPPAAAPATEVPRVPDAPSTPPPPGSARVLIDANGEPAHVEEVVGIEHAFDPGRRRPLWGTTMVTRTLCHTVPCAVDLPRGEHDLVFTAEAPRAGDTDRSDVVTVHAVDPVTVVRRTIGYTERPQVGDIGGVMAGVGVMSAVFCWVPFVVGAAANDPGTRGSWDQVGVGMAVAGGVAIVVGATLAIIGAPRYTPGATTQWSIPEPVPAVAR